MSEWKLPNEPKVSKIGYKLVDLHWDSSQNGWILKDIFTASDYTAFNIAYIKYISWAVFQNGMRVTQPAYNFRNCLWIGKSSLRFEIIFPGLITIQHAKLLIINVI